MKILNIGNNSIVVKDIRGNNITVAPYQIVEVSEKQAKRLSKVYKFKIVEEIKPVEPEKTNIDTEKIKKVFSKKKGKAEDK